MFKSEKQKRLTYAVFGIYLFFLTWLVLFKLSFDFNLPAFRNINLVPFGASLVVNGQVNISEIIYNVLAFIPLGIYLSMFKAKQNIFIKILIGLGISLFFEVVQYVFAIGASDITDIITNTIGCIIGLLLFKLFKRLFKKKTVSVINGTSLVLESGALALILIIIIANA